MRFHRELEELQVKDATVYVDDRQEAFLKEEGLLDVSVCYRLFNRIGSECGSCE
jgi:hypothetical protein